MRFLSQKIIKSMFGIARMAISLGLSVNDSLNGYAFVSQDAWAAERSHCSWSFQTEPRATYLCL